MSSVAFKEGTYGFFGNLDYENLAFVLQHKPIRCMIACHYAQQCIEKYLKQMASNAKMSLADLVMHGQNLVEIAQAVGYPNVEKYQRELLLLGNIYSEWEYPNEIKSCMPVEPTPGDVQKAVEIVEDVRSWVFSTLVIVER